MIPATPGGVYTTTRPRVLSPGKMIFFNEWTVGFASLNEAFSSSTSLPAKISDIEASDGDFSIVDGITKHDSAEISRACYTWSKQQDKHLFVTVSSVSIPVALQEEEEEANAKTYSVPSWTLEQYQQACEDEHFFNGVKSIS